MNKNIVDRTTVSVRWSYLTAFIIVSLIIGILLVFYLIIIFNKETKEKREAIRKKNVYRQQLESRIDELTILNLESIELKNIEHFTATGRILRTIAHEVRNSLTNINLATEQLQNEIPATEDVSFLFEMISRNSKKINLLMSSLLDSTRISSLQYAITSINDVLDNSMESAADIIELKHIKVVKDYDKDIGPISVDKEKVQIALLNIIVNAVEAMEDHGTLYLVTETRNDRCITKVTDNGKGLSKEDMARLFEPYFTTKEKGNGLSLTNTQNIILGHNARISVESELGKGTSFTISFAFA
jgi:signal transduction histidine kinase